MLTLNDRRSELWQWDTGRKLTVDADCSQVHFSNKVFGRSIDVDVVDGIVDIPDTLLQTDKELTAWAFVGTAENGYTKISKVFKVNKRNKPADYVFTEPDQTTLGEILGRIEDLENRPSGDVSKEDIQDAVNEYLDNNPVSVDEKDPTVPDWAKQPQKPTYTAAEVGALPDTTKIPSTAEDVGALPANAFIPKTAADVGAIPVPETATVGQTIVVKEVDEDGKPVSWECADVAGGDKWELINSYTTPEDMVDIEIYTDLNGEPFALKDIGIKIVKNVAGGPMHIEAYDERSVMYRLAHFPISHRQSQYYRKFYSDTFVISRWDTAADISSEGAGLGFTNTVARVANKILLSSYEQAVFVAGTYIELWGVRA